MQEHPKTMAHRSIVSEAMQKAAIEGVLRAEADRTTPSPSRTGMALDPTRAALVVIDPDADFLRAMHGGTPVRNGTAAQRQTIQNLTRLLKAADHAGITVAASVTAEGFRTAGVMPELRPFIAADATIICSPHKRYSPLPRVNDSGLQLRRQSVRQIILAGVIANLRLETHLRDFLEQGFEIAVVRDAVAGPKLPEGDGYLCALINFRRLAHALLTTDEVVSALRRTADVSVLAAEECLR
jgi:nicotinamidase-related amidase